MSETDLLQKHSPDQSRKRVKKLTEQIGVYSMALFDDLFNNPKSPLFKFNPLTATVDQLRQKHQKTYVGTTLTDEVYRGRFYYYEEYERIRDKIKDRIGISTDNLVEVASIQDRDTGRIQGLYASVDNNSDTEPEYFTIFRRHAPKATSLRDFVNYLLHGGPSDEVIITPRGKSEIVIP